MLAKRVGFLIVILLLLTHGFRANGFTLGLVAKSIDDRNFINAWEGCAQQAHKQGDRCLLIGSKGPTQVREQVAALQHALAAEPIDALAISVTNSNFLAAWLSQLKIPIITYDSPFNDVDRHLSRTYIGVHNVQFGRELARTAKNLKPVGGNLCIMTSLHNSNLEERVQGVRQELSGDYTRIKGQRLKGESGWNEQDRCPWDTGDSVDRALDEITLSFNNTVPTVLISVGAWPVVDVTAFRKTTLPFQQNLIEQQHIVIMGVGTHLPEYTSLLKDQLIHGFVSIDFPAIGRIAAKTMRAILLDKPVPEVIYIPFNSVINIDTP